MYLNPPPHHLKLLLYCRVEFIKNESNMIITIQVWGGGVNSGESFSWGVNSME